MMPLLFDADYAAFFVMPLLSFACFAFFIIFFDVISPLRFCHF